MRRILERANTALETRLAGWLLLGALAVLYTAAYVLHPLFPGTGADAATRGWWTWNDQSRYLAETAAIATGRLSPANFNYPIGYPALGAPFWRWWPAHPFFVPDLVLVLAAAAALWRVARRWLSGLRVVVVAAGYVAMQAAVLGATLVVPWNTIPTQAALLAGVAVTLGWTGRRRVLALAGLAAATYVVKSSDAAAFAPLLVFAVWSLPTWRERLRSAVAGGAILAAGVVAVGLLHLAVFGQWRSTYEVASVQLAGFFAYPVALKVWWLLVDGRWFFNEWDPALLWRHAWLWLAVPGAVWLVRRERAAGGAVLAAVAVSWGLYLNYNDFTPPNLYRFTLIHYLTWSFPLLLLLGVAAVVAGGRERAVWGGFAAMAALVVFAGGVRVEERARGAVAAVGGGWKVPAQRPLVVRFRGVKPEAAAQLRLDGRPINERIDFLVPYVDEPELRVMLSDHATGAQLSFAAGGAAGAIELSEPTWAWRFSPARFRRIGR